MPRYTRGPQAKCMLPWFSTESGKRFRDVPVLEFRGSQYHPLPCSLTLGPSTRQWTTSKHHFPSLSAPLGITSGVSPVVVFIPHTPFYFLTIHGFPFSTLRPISYTFCRNIYTATAATAGRSRRCTASVTSRPVWSRRRRWFCFSTGGTFLSVLHLLGPPWNPGAWPPLPALSSEPGNARVAQYV